MVCPLCGTKLEVKQINFDTAILLCPNLKCSYPVGTECLQIKRNFDNIRKEVDVIILPEISDSDDKKTLLPLSKQGDNTDCSVLKTESNAMSVIKQIENDFSALETQRIKISQFTQTDGVYDVMEFIPNENKINSSTPPASDEELDVDFDVDEFLNNLK